MNRKMTLTVAVLCLAAGGALVADAAWIQTKAAVANVMIRSAWIDAKAGGASPRPWPWADTWPVARLQAPSLGVDQIVLAGASGRTLAFGPAHVSGSAQPNETGNTVIGGHREVSYTVTGAAVVRAETRLPVAASSRKLTLVTCWPFDALTSAARDRYVVTAIADEAT